MLARIAAVSSIETMASKSKRTVITLEIIKGKSQRYYYSLTTWGPQVNIFCTYHSKALHIEKKALAIYIVLDL